MIDLQIHTTDSDGTWSWDRALEHCRSIGLTAFAITDHDTVVRHGEIRRWARENRAQAIPGIELSTRQDGQTVHLLGYFLDGPLGGLQKRLDYLMTGRRERNTLIVRRLQELGLPISEDEVGAEAGAGTPGRPHIARVLLKKRLVASIQEAFDRYLASKGKAYFPKDELPLREGIELLHAAGAVTSVAHPGLLKRPPTNFEDTFKEWRDWGLDGIEAIYPMYTPDQQDFFLTLARKLDFLVTGGSDFHGENKPHIAIGTGTGALNVPDSLLEPLFARRAEIDRHIGVPVPA